MHFDMNNYCLENNNGTAIKGRDIETKKNYSGFFYFCNARIDINL